MQDSLDTQETVEKLLNDTREIERFRNLIRTRLRETGWTENLEIYCENYIQKNKYCTEEELHEEVERYARAAFSPTLRKQLKENALKSIGEDSL